MFWRRTWKDALSELESTGWKVLIRGYIKHGIERHNQRAEDVGQLVFVDENHVFATIMKKNQRTKFVVVDFDGNVVQEADSHFMFHCYNQVDVDERKGRIGTVQEDRVLILDRELNILKEIKLDVVDKIPLVGFAFSRVDENIVYVSYPKQNNGLSPYISGGKGEVYAVDLRREEIVSSYPVDAFHLDTLLEWGTRNELLVLARYRNGFVQVIEKNGRERNRIYFPYPHGVRTSPEGMVAVSNGVYMVESNLFMVLGDVYNDYSRGGDPPFWGVGDVYHYGTLLTNNTDFHPIDPRIITWSRVLSGGVAFLPQAKTLHGEIAFIQLANGINTEKGQWQKVKIEWARDYTYLPVYGEARVYFSLEGEVRVWRKITGYTPFGGKTHQPTVWFTRKVGLGEPITLGTGIYYFDFRSSEDGKLYSWAEIPLK